MTARRLATTALAALAVLGCTTATTSLLDTTREQARTVQAAPAVAPVPGQFKPLGIEPDGHNGFPTATALPDGTLRLMWRHGSSHASSDGEILTSVSADQGATWSPPEHAVVDNGEDVRDPHLGPSGLSSVGGDVFLTYFVSDDGVPTGARVARSTDGGATFEPSVRIDPNMPWAAISSPVTSIGGKLWTAFYGRKTGETVDSAYAAWSTDNGQTWTSVRIAVGAPGNAYQEPWVVEGASNTAVFIMRDGTWRNLASRTTDTTTGVWSPINRAVLTGATGNSATVRGSNGRLYLVYRDTQTRAAKLASSGDNGLTWTFERELMWRPAGATTTVGMTYAHPIEVGNGYIWCPVGLERSDKDSSIYLGWL